MHFLKIEKKNYVLIHNNNHHCDFHKTYAKIINFLYIKHLTKRFRKYIKYCKKCMKNQIMKHVSYEKLKFINIMILFFHIIIIDFIVNMSKILDEMNAIFFTIDKFCKRINFVAKKITWNVFEWIVSWLIMLQKKTKNYHKLLYWIEILNLSQFFENSRSIIWNVFFCSLSPIIFKLTNSQKKRTKLWKLFCDIFWWKKILSIFRNFFFI